MKLQTPVPLLLLLMHVMNSHVCVYICIHICIQVYFMHTCMYICKYIYIHIGLHLKRVVAEINFFIIGMLARIQIKRVHNILLFMNPVMKLRGLARWSSACL